MFSLSQKYHYVWYKVCGKGVILLKTLTCLVILIFLIYPGRFAKPYAFIPDAKIESYLSLAWQPDSNACSSLPNATSEIINIIPSPIHDEAELAKEYHINLGGSWSPSVCEPVHDVALIIPYRDRKQQLMVFLKFMHKFLQSQFISYRIFVIEQAVGKPFNRGKLMNIGYKEALKLNNYPCFIFHDVDLLPQVRRNIYGCTKLPRHMSSSINIWRYNLLYDGAFGGATAILSDQFMRANGFSNLYFGWGAEDDDFLMRIHKTGLEIVRFSPEISRYFMLPHKAEEKNPNRLKILNQGEIRSADDGLNSLEYQIIAYHTLPLYTHVLVEL